MEKPSQKLIDASSALFQEVISLHQRGQLDAAKDAYQALLEIYPEDHRILSNLGALYLQQGELQKGISMLEASLALHEDQPHAHNSLGNAMAAMGLFEPSLEHFKKAIKNLPDLPEPYANRANALHRVGQFDEALESIQEAIVIKSDSPEWHLLKATILFSRSSYEASLRSIEEALSYRPHFVEALEQKGMTLSALGRYQEALTCYDVILKGDPAAAYTHLRRGIALQFLGHDDDALMAYKNALALKPDDESILTAYGTFHFYIKSYPAALEALQQALTLNPHSFEALTNRANTLLHLKRPQEALEDFSMAISLQPTNAQAHLNRSEVYWGMGSFHRALQDLSLAYQLDRSRKDVLTIMLFAALKSFEWARLFEILSVIRCQVDQGVSVGTPFGLLAACDDPFFHKKASRLYLDEIFKGPPSEGIKPPLPASGKIRVGYFSSDFRDHPVSHNLLPVLKAHDRNQFTLIGFCFGPSAAEEPVHEILHQFDIVHQIGDDDDLAAAALAKSLGLHIAIDLNGHTIHSRTGIFNQRVAPIQVNYLGYPGTMGSSFHDYIIADQWVIPEADQGYYSEKVVRLPHFFMPYSFHDIKMDWRMRRSQVGLPEDLFVLCSFNDFYKVSEEIFAAWMAILATTENTVLFLSIRGDITEEALMGRVRAQGADPKRMILADRTKSLSEHLSRLALCDLMLDTFPYNSHTTACDAISAGLPIVTIRGQSFASRVTSSLLEHIGVSDLIANSLTEYQEKVIDLANKPHLHRSLRDRIVEGRKGLPSSKEYTRNLESLFEFMVRDSHSMVTKD